MNKEQLEKIKLTSLIILIIGIYMVPFVLLLRVTQDLYYQADHYREGYCTALKSEYIDNYCIKNNILLHKFK